MRKSVGKILRKCHLNSKYKGYLYIQDSVDIIVSCETNLSGSSVCQCYRY